MDWYGRNSANDLDVHKDSELLSVDRILSPENWLNLEQKYFDTEESAAQLSYYCKELDDLMAKNQSSSTSSVNHDRDRSSGSSISCTGEYSDPHEILVQSTSMSCCDPSNEELDYEHYRLAGLEQVAEIYLNSVLGNEDQTNMFDFPTEPQCDSMANNNYNDDDDIDVNDVSAYNSNLALIPCDSESPHWQPTQGNLAAGPFDTKTIHGYEVEESSLEESILDELKMVMEKLPEKTRICFRDSLYRLANNSMSSRCTSTTLDHERAGGIKKEVKMETHTNSIDRAVGNLMFNYNKNMKEDFNATHAQQQEMVSSSRRSPLMSKYSSCSSKKHEHNDHINHHNWPNHIPDLQYYSDAQVPVFNQMDLVGSNYNSKAMMLEFGSS